MYGFLDSQTKRKAFRKALNNAFDSGYDPSSVASKTATPVSLGQTVEPVVLEKPIAPPTLKKARVVHKPESGLIDLSKHKDWRGKQENKIQSKTQIERPRGVSLYDELFPESREVSSFASNKTKTDVNSFLDKAMPEANEEGFAEEFVFPKEPVEKPEVQDDEESWEELLKKLDLGSFDDEAEDLKEEKPVSSKPLKLDIVREENVADVEPVKEEALKQKEVVEKPAAKKPVVATKKSTASTAKKTAASSTKKSTKPAAKVEESDSKVSRSKKRKNKIKFDADIIGGW